MKHIGKIQTNKEGVLTIIDVVNKDADDKKIFPFILQFTKRDVV